MLVAQWTFVHLIRLECPDFRLKTKSIISENGGVMQILRLLFWAQQEVSQESSALRREREGTSDNMKAVNNRTIQFQSTSQQHAPKRELLL